MKKYFPSITYCFAFRKVQRGLVKEEAGVLPSYPQVTDREFTTTTCYMATWSRTL